MKIINLNAPPLSGKDEIAKYFVNKHFAIHMELKATLVNIAVKTAGISRKLWDALYDRRYKEIPSPFLLVDGKFVSPRQWLIHMSENVIKPTFGQDIFGKILAEKINKLSLPEDSVIVLSDGGFVEETLPLIDLVGEDNYYIARISRFDEEGKMFEWGNDSRRWLSLKKEIPQADFINYPNRILSCAEEIWRWSNNNE